MGGALPRVVISTFFFPKESGRIVLQKPDIKKQVVRAVRAIIENVLQSIVFGFVC